MPKVKLTLSIQDDLIQRMKIQAVYDRKSVSRITEELYEEYLKKREGKKH